MESRAFGRLVELRYPDWLTERYADLVAKPGVFDVRENRRLLLAGDPRLDHVKSGLYQRYHLMIATLLAKLGARIHQLLTDPPEEEDVLRALQATR